MSSPILLDRAASFVDDTSSNLTRAPGHRVSIHAQLPAQCALEWFDRLLKKVPNDGRELKSDVLARTFFVLPADEQRALLRTLRTVRVHITDPRPYLRRLEETIKGILPGQTLESLLTRLENADKPAGIRVRRTLMESVALDMLRNSPYEQLKLRFRALNVLASISIDVEGDGGCGAETEPQIDYSPFLNKSGKLLVDRVALFTSKAGPVFSSALELTDDLMNGVADEFPSIWAVSFKLYRRLSALHIFDHGNDRALSWIERRRSESLSFVDAFGLSDMLRAPRALVSIDSRTSRHVQAADVAAGIARSLFETDAKRLRTTFDCVMQNGRQIGASAR